MNLDLKYEEFLLKKSQIGSMEGFKPLFMPSFLFDFQQFLTDWSIQKGKSAIFADCGLGKTPMQLVWAENILRKTNKPILILTPLAVSQQTAKEGEKFGIEVKRTQGQVYKSINVTNYEKIHYFNPLDFGGVICDESSILKNFDGIRKAQITEFMRQISYRLLCTATAAPNDYIELGTSSEALGELGYVDMLTRFFTNSEHTVKARNGKYSNRDSWVFKGHAEVPFWKWVCSWSRACRYPSDLGYENGKFILPALTENEHIVKARNKRADMLFDLPAIGLAEEREVKRRTIPERCEAAAQLIKHDRPAVIWCHLNAEGDYLAKIIPGAEQISGSDDDEFKEEKFEAFRTGKLRVLIIKPKIGAFGLNWQHCAHIVYFASHSYEQYYQAVRRCWRFGQNQPVKVDLIRTDCEERIVENMKRKADQADKMFSDLVRYMNKSIQISAKRDFNNYVEVPSWL